MTFKDALSTLQRIKPLCQRSTFGEALDIVCNVAEHEYIKLPKCRCIACKAELASFLVKDDVLEVITEHVCNNIY
jgi:hypothetical protein